MVGLVALIALQTLVSADVKTDALVESVVYDCMSNYLRTQKLLERSHHFRRNKENKITTNGTQCDVQIAFYRNTFYTEMENDLKEDEDLAPQADCLVENLRKSDLAEFSMKRLVYENSRKMSKRKLKKALKAIDYAIEKRTETAVTLCTSDKVFGDMFDATYANANTTDSSEEETPEEDYCERKYMVDNNFINPAYHVSLNPKNVNVSNLNCDEIVEHSITEAVNELRGEFEDELERPSKRTLKCVTKAIRTGHYFESIARIVMLGEIGISDTDKAEERKKFIDGMKQLYENVLKC